MKTRNLVVLCVALVFALVEDYVGVFQRRVLAGLFAGDEVADVGRARFFVQFHEVRVHHAGAHQVNAGEQHAIDV